MSQMVEQPASPALSPHQRIEELGRIIMAYSEVTDKLQQSHERLERTVTALREELSEKNRLLERKNRLAALGEMAAGMAHEIRNPLGGIQLYASMLARDVADRPASADVVRKISAGVKRLEGLVGQVLQFAREIRPNRVPADVREVIDNAVELLVQEAEARGVSIHIHGPRKVVANIDPLLIGQAIMNLVLNAIQAMENGGCVELILSPCGGEREFVLSIADNGPGIDAAVMDRIFNPFFTTRATGTGLGLALVHRIIEAHEGSISVRNAEAGGAVFEIRT